jgi:hypothetical protein
MCNLYSITTNQAAIAAIFRVVKRYVGNLPPMPGVYHALGHAAFTAYGRGSCDQHQEHFATSLARMAEA